MANLSALISVIFIGILWIPETDAGIISDVIDGIFKIIQYILASADSIVKEILNPPQNVNSSIVYTIFTPENTKEPCYLEQNEESLERCPFNATYPLKFLIHGFLVEEPPLFQVKDEILQFYEYNVILMDWKRYNNPPYLLSALNTLLIGHELANFIQFLKTAKGVDPRNIHLIGHSLGAHISGVAGKQTPNLGRITGLDPAAPLFSSKSLLHRLTYTDANFVDVIHSSIGLLGFGISEPIGHQDFYPNGGDEQPQCIAQQNSQTFKQRMVRNAEEHLESPNKDLSLNIDVHVCDHSASSQFFVASINIDECVFSAVKCDSYGEFQTGVCSTSSKSVAEMGLPAEPIAGLDPKTKFYLRTTAKKPYCLADGYEPE